MKFRCWEERGGVRKGRRLSLLLREREEGWGLPIIKSFPDKMATDMTTYQHFSDASCNTEINVLYFTLTTQYTLIIGTTILNAKT